MWKVVGVVFGVASASDGLVAESLSGTYQKSDSPTRGPENDIGVVIPCKDGYDEWNAIDWTDESGGYYDEMNFGVMLGTESLNPKVTCGDVYKLEVEEKTPRYVHIMGYQEDDGWTTVQLQLDATVMTAVGEDTKVSLRRIHQEADGELDDVVDEMPVDTAIHSVSDLQAAGYYKCGAENPDGMDAAALFELIWDTGIANFPEIPTDSVEPRCGDILTIFGPKGQHQVLLTHEGIKINKKAFGIAIEEEACKAVCEEVDCPSGGYISHNCLVTFVEESRTTPPPTIPPTGDEGEFVAIFGLPWDNFAGCSSLSCFSHSGLDVETDCGSKEKPCPASVSSLADCGKLLEVYNPMNGASTFVVIYDGTNEGETISISDPSWKALCPKGCSQDGVTFCQSECHDEQTLEEDYCACVKCFNGSVDGSPDQCQNDSACDDCSGACMRFPGSFRSHSKSPLLVRDTKEFVKLPATSSAFGSSCAAMVAASSLF